MADTITAYSVYHYNSVGVGQGMAGTIDDSGSTVTTSPNLHTDLNGDPKVEGFVSGSDLRIAVTDYVTGQAQPVKVYNAINPASPAPVTQTLAK